MIPSALLDLLRGDDQRVHRKPLPARTSFAIDLVHIGEGNARFVLKRYEETRLHREDAIAQGLREIEVYRRVLDHERLGTARYCGHLDDPGQRCWLLLEYVEGEQLQRGESAVREQAARWLALLQASARPHGLPEHDAGFFRGTALRAVAAVECRHGDEGRRLRKVVESLDPVIELWLEQPRTVVHGSFRAENLLIDKRHEPPRICPIDWEHAALGSPLYDLAFLSCNHSRNKVRRLCEAYLDAARGLGLPTMGIEDVVTSVRSFWLFKHLRSLCRCVEWNFRDESTRGLVTLVEELRHDLR
ncbi:MAG TPA: aminoglycoside phosphotransferase family protein [Planctomycetota bacterium]|nr:aminoglycoside phosphotransferase family protein [Planctomycetota bacterium]